MPDAREDNSKTFDPFDSFKSMRDSYLNAMSKTMVDAVNTESYAQATGSMLDFCLSASASFRDALEKSMTQALQQLSMPSRQDVASLAERFTNMEMRLDDLDAKADRLVRAVEKLEKSQTEVHDRRRAPSARKRG
jgi:polyhydroxyalkanoic acid synthase PhaR subunit